MLEKATEWVQVLRLSWLTRQGTKMVNALCQLSFCPAAADSIVHTVVQRVELVASGAPVCHLGGFFPLKCSDILESSTSLLPFPLRLTSCHGNIKGLAMWLRRRRNLWIDGGRLQQGQGSISKIDVKLCPLAFGFGFSLGDDCCGN